MPDLAFPKIEQLALTPISSLPDEPFFDVVTPFLQSVDTVYFNDRGLQEPVAVSIRSTLANRLMASNGWQRLRDSRSTAIEIHLGPAVAVFFFNDHNFVQPAKCYLLPKGIDRVEPFFPVLEKLVESGPSFFVAVVTLNFLEVAPRSEHLQLIVLAAKTWLKNLPKDGAFWVDHGIGQRVCVLIEKIRGEEPTLLDTDKAVRIDVDRLLAALITLGVPEAKRLEEALAEEPGSGA